jgi:hypothetical protein
MASGNPLLSTIGYLVVLAEGLIMPIVEIVRYILAGKPRFGFSQVSMLALF